MTQNEAPRLAESPGFDRPVQWAVFTLDNGAEIRVRNLGDRVEVRTWDLTESCNPPRLTMTRVGRHVIDVQPAPAAECDHLYPPVNADGTCPSCGKRRA